MTENEAISAIQNDLEWHSKELKPKYKKVLEYAIQALEKVQQFEAIGTIEEIKALKNKHIGKDNMVISSSDLMTILNSDSEELKQYKEVGTVEECRVAVERMKPKKPNKPIFKFEYEDGRQFYDCPVCGAYVMHAGVQSKERYCSNCGAKLDWSE